MKQKTARVSIIILNWNGKHLLEQNLSSVLSQRYTSYEIIIVDNGSSDGSQKYIKELREKDNRIRFLETGKNFGYAEGNNKGIQFVLKEAKSKYIVILNNDVFVQKYWLRNLIRGFTINKVGVCTSKILLYYPYLPITLIPHEDCIIYSIKILDLNYHSLLFNDGFFKKGALIHFPLRLYAHKAYSLAVPYPKALIGELELKYSTGVIDIVASKKQYSLHGSGTLKLPLKEKYIIQNAGTFLDNKTKTFEDRYIFQFDRKLNLSIVDAGCGASMVLRSDLLKKFGVFNKKYFMYGEDSELCYRLRRNGYMTKFIPDAECYHYFWGSSKGKVTSKQTFYGTRNRLWFIRRYFGLFPFIYFYLRTLSRTLSWGVKYLLRKNAESKMFYDNYSKVLREALHKDS